jgi:signal transduction histidine kinase
MNVAGALLVKNPSANGKLAAASRTLALLNGKAEAVRAELASLRQHLGRMEEEVKALPGSALVQANERLVLAAMRAQAIADTAKSNLDAVLAEISPASELARAENEARLRTLRAANEHLVIAALTSQQQEVSAREAHRHQLTFLAMVAHELRNPLMPLRLASELLKRAPANEGVVSKVHTTIDRQVDHMARLIEDLLDGSRAGTGKFRLQRSIVDVCSIIELAIETCRPAVDARRHRLASVMPAGPLSVDGDPVRLVQVLGNLLENASKYTPAGGDISLNAVALGDVVAITIADNGIGITAQALPHVFELFVRDEHATALNRGGLGIGLAVVAELVEAHGGSVVATSDGKGLGSEFVVTLPLAAVSP